MILVKMNVATGFHAHGPKRRRYARAVEVLREEVRLNSQYTEILPLEASYN